jgi:hypothetical protein
MSPKIYLFVNFHDIPVSNGDANHRAAVLHYQGGYWNKRQDNHLQKVNPFAGS